MSINQISPEGLPLHQAVESNGDQTVEQALKNQHPDCGSSVNARNETADFKQLTDEEAFYRLMKRQYMAALGVLIERRKDSRESLAQAWRRLEIENVQISPEMENFVHLRILRFEFEAINARVASVSMDGASKKRVMELLMDGIDQLVERQGEGGNLCHDVSCEFLEMLRAILKLLDAARRVEYFPIEKLKFCVAIYLAIHDRKPSFNLYHLLINKVMVVNFLKQFKIAHQDPSKILDNRMTNDLVLDMGKILVQNSEKNCKRVLDLWASYFESKNMSKIYTQTEQIMIHSILRKTSVKEMVTHVNSTTVPSEESKPAREVAKSINDMFTSVRFDHEFKALSKLFSDIKDLYSLTKVINHLKMLENISYSVVNALGILRVMQVIGETLKSTTETPNISAALQSLLLGNTPDQVLESISEMRNFLSHDFTDQKYSFYKEIGEDRTKHSELYRYAKILLKLKPPLVEAYERTVVKCLEAFLRRISLIDSVELIHSICKVIDLRPVLRENLNFQNDHDGSYGVVLKDSINELFLPCINLLLMTDDLQELHRLSRLYLRSFSSAFAVWNVPNSRAKQKRIHKLVNENGWKDQVPSYNKLPTKHDDASDLTYFFESTLAYKAGRFKEGFIITSDYLKLEIKHQQFEFKVFNDEMVNEFLNRLKPYFKNVLNIDEKYRTFKSVCKSHNLRTDNKLITAMRKKDQECLNTIFQQLVQYVADIVSFGNEITEAEMVSMVTSSGICEIEHAAVEMVMIDVLEILINRNVFPQHSSFITTVRPVISGRFMRNYLAHDGLIYDTICRNSRNLRASTLLNCICLLRYLNVELFNDSKHSKRVATQCITFQTVAGNLPLSDASDTGKDKLDRLIDCLCQLSSDKVESFCCQNKVDEIKWQELILHAISSKNEISAQKLLDRFWLSKANLSEASFLIPAVTKRMPNLVQRICELDPANIDYVNADQQTALYRAVEVGCKESIGILIRFNARVHREPHSPLLRAIELRRDDIFNTLMSSNETLAMNPILLMEILRPAAKYNRSDLLEQFLHVVWDKEASICLLKIAIKHNNLASVKVLLNSDSSLARLDAASTPSPFKYACHVGSTKMVQLFLSHGADCNLPQKTGPVFIPLHCGNRSLLKFFLQSGKINQETGAELFQQCLLHSEPKLAWEVLQAGHPFGLILDKTDWDGVKNWLPGMCRRKPDIIDQLDGYALGLAILDGMHTFVIRIFKKVFPRLSNQDHGRLLNCAILKQDIMMLKYLIRNGLNVNHADASDLTPLGMALSLRWCYIRKYNTDKFANKKTNEEEEKRKRCLEICEIVEILLTAGADVNKKTYRFFQSTVPWYGRDHLLEGYVKVFQFPIAMAVSIDNNELIEQLLQEGALINVQNDDGRSTLLNCIEWDLVEMTDKLIGLGADLEHARNYVYPDGGSVLHYLVQLHHFKMYKHLVDSYKFDETLANSNGNTVLHIAIIYQNLDILNYFLNKDSFWDVPNDDGHTPVQLALHRMDRISLKNRKMFNAIKTRAGFVNEMYSFPFYGGRTLLHNVALSKNVPNDLINSLIYEYKMDVNGTDYAGLTPFHYMLEQGNLYYTNVFIEAGAALFPKEVDKQNIFSYLKSVLATRTDIVTILLRDQDTVDALKECSVEGKNLLQLAILQDDYSLCKLLDSAGFDPNVLDSKGNSTLHLAASVNSTRLAALFLSKGLCIDAMNNVGATPVLLALAADNNKVANYLLMKGASMDSAILNYQYQEQRIPESEEDFELD